MLNGPRLNKTAATHWAGPAYVKQPLTAQQPDAGQYKYQGLVKEHDSVDVQNLELGFGGQRSKSSQRSK